ncbi:cornifelin homolog A-like [Sardina pilchardus]|uniref:cornifelin homolog A-like n=1 Tax=Sardina pilchardus TaxID=27697 RepID=UPI002E141522
MSHPLGHSAVTTNQPRRPEAEKIEWSSRLSGFCEDKSMCCYALTCPLLMSTGVTEQYGEGFGLGAVPFSLMALRSDIRERYNIKGSLCLDWMVGCCCGPCAVVQMAKEVNKRHPY